MKNFILVNLAVALLGISGAHAWTCSSKSIYVSGKTKAIAVRRYNQKCVPRFGSAVCRRAISCAPAYSGGGSDSDGGHSHYDESGASDRAVENLEKELEYQRLREVCENNRETDFCRRNYRP